LIVSDGLKRTHRRCGRDKRGEGAGTPFISFYAPDEMLALAGDAGFNGT
jgi:hypothetical protein